ncbi:hypothetical protein J4447_04665 [Candidatus Pacearchaeota archaeon]|nr:hypothetical protein [Candidatus Pacearchaeota archaeon]
MKDNIIVMTVILLLGLGLGLANALTEQEMNDAKSIIDSEISCENLSDSQLEMLGEYYMEQMHSGESHELMDKMMGGEGSESLKQAHINMAKTLYCNENAGGMMSSGGMGGMMGMMNMMGEQNPYINMMGNWKYGRNYSDSTNILYVILLIGVIILVYLWNIKLWRDIKNRGSRR